MKDLINILEGVLDADLDVELTIGDTYDLVINLPIYKTGVNATEWKFQGFWTKYEGIQNAWTRERHIAMKNELRLRALKTDIRHAFIMYLLTQPTDQKIDQKFVDGCVGYMNRMCNTAKLQLKVSVEFKNGEYVFNMWNRAIKDATKNYMGTFYLTPRKTNEGILDITPDDELPTTFFDLAKDVRFNALYSMDGMDFKRICGLIRKQNYAHYKKNSYGPSNPYRYLYDFAMTLVPEVLKDTKGREAAEQKYWNEIGSKNTHMYIEVDENTFHFQWTFRKKGMEVVFAKMRIDM